MAYIKSEASAGCPISIGDLIAGGALGGIPLEKRGSLKSSGLLACDEFLPSYYLKAKTYFSII